MTPNSKEYTLEYAGRSNLRTHEGEEETEVKSKGLGNIFNKTTIATT